MKIPCLRCNKEIDTPDASNADYIIAGDTRVKEFAENGTLMEIQKTGIICPDCYRDSDFVIWGVHKK